MFFEKNPLSSAVGYAIAGAATLGFASSGAYAQDGGDVAGDSADTLEEVYVTGSRIKRPNIEGASPVTVISQEQLAATGLTDVGDLLQRLPSAAGSPIGTTTNNGGDGSVRVDLRGMGTARTLTLVNGKRTVDQGDYQTIPANMIERVEILKDGASTVYGADAVAGVVNIITKTDFEGLELTAQTNNWTETDGGAQNSIGLLAGKAFDGGNFVFGIEHVDQDEVYQRDTPWDYFQDSFYIYPEGCENNLTDPYPTGCYRIGSSRIPESRLGFVSQGTFLVGTPAAGPYQAGDIIPHDGRNYNYAPVNYMQTPYERTNVFANANFDLSDNLRFKTEFRGNVRNSAQELAPQPYNSPTDPAYNGVFNGTAYSGISEDNYYLRQAIDRYNAATGAGLVYEPVRDARRRMIETTRRFEQDIQQYQVDMGFEGEFNDISWEVFANRGYQSNQSIDFGQFSGPALFNALGPSADLNGDGRPECYGDINDPSSLIVGCVPLNFFGGGSVVRETGETVADSLTQDMIDYVSVVLSDQFIQEQTNLGFSFTGSFGEMQGGSIGWAAGYNYRKQDGRFTPDSAKASDSVTGNTGAGTEGSITNQSYFGEMVLPVFDNGTQNLTIDLGLRHDTYNVTDDATTYSAKFDFGINDDLRMRATYGTVFRAPGLFALFGGLNDGFPTINDPCAIAAGQALPAGCAQVAVQSDNQILTRSGGNPLLRPEEGNTFTAGIVWTPEFGDNNFTATLDYWEIELEDGIGNLGGQNILDQCHVSGNQDACALITRRPGDYSVAQILDGALNISEQGAKGVDIELKWDREFSFGIIDASMLWTHSIERSRIAFDGEPEEDLSGRYTDPTAADGGARPENKANFSVGWTHDSGFSLNYLGEFIGEMDADTFCNCGAGNQPDGTYIQAIDSQLYHDIVGSYDINENLTVSAGITNVTNEEPPFIEVGFNASTDPATYREFGRGYYLRLKWDMQ